MFDFSQQAAQMGAEKIPASAPAAAPVQKDDPGFFSVLAQAHLRNSAQRGSALAEALQSQLFPEEYKREQQMRSNAVRLAELQIQQAQQNVELFPLRKREAEVRLAELESMQPLKQKKAELDLQEQSNRIAMFPHAQQEAELKNQSGAMQLQENQKAIWLRDYEQNRKIYMEHFHKQIGFDDLNIYTQDYLDNSPDIEALIDLIGIMHAYSRSDAEGDFILQQAGWLREKREDGEYLLSDTGDVEVKLDQENMKKIISDIQEKAKADIEAARISGTDAVSLRDMATKRILNSPDMESIFGTKGAALGSYQMFLENGVPKTKDFPGRPFTKAELAGHDLAETLLAAVVDKKISQEEKQILAPLFATTVKSMGGEVIYPADSENGDIDVSKIMLRKGDGSMVDLETAARDLSQRDIVAHLWELHKQDLVSRMDNNAAEGSDDPRGLSDDEYRKYRAAYGDELLTLSAEQEEEFAKIDREFTADLQREGVPPEQLTLDTLRAFDTQWDEAIEEAELPESFYSPFQNIIFKKELDDLYAQRAKLEKEIAELGDVGIPKAKRYSRAGAPLAIEKTDAQRKKEKLDKKLAQVEKGISMRESKLKARGIIPAEGGE